MNRSPSKFLLWYDHLFEFLAAKRREKGDLELRWIHTLTVSVLSTGILMWAYTGLACFAMNSTLPGALGIFLSLIHILSPLLFRFTNNVYLISNIFIGSGFIHQAVFGYYSGGFNSFCLKWFAILPLLAGITSGRKGAITWFILTMSANLGFLILNIQGHQFPYELSKTGYILGNSLILFGFIFLTTILISIYVYLGDRAEKILMSQRKKIDDLFRVLFHDLANPLGRLDIGLNLTRREVMSESAARGLEIASQASNSMMEITENVRKMYALSKGDSNVNLTHIPLNEAVNYIQKVFSTDLQKKDINVIYDHFKYQGLSILVEPISFKNQVLGNILSNAIKFSPPSGSVNIIAYPISQQFFAIEVRDFGIGIPQHLLPHVFDFSKKVNRPGTLGEPGTGFGMQIMKSFIEMYGGSVSVESKESTSGLPSGTTIRLVLRGKWT